MNPVPVPLTLGVEHERRRILGIIWQRYTEFKSTGDERIAGVLEMLTREITHDHREDSER
jgi:hypothetical protein